MTEIKLESIRCDIDPEVQRKMEEYMDFHFQSYGLAEVQLVTKVLSKFLGREFSSEDATDVQRVFAPDWLNKYLLFYKGIRLGIVEYHDHSIVFKADPPALAIPVDVSS